MIRIESRVFAQGSFGLHKINPRNGSRIGHAIRVWTVFCGNSLVGRYLSREEARQAARQFKTRGAK